MTNTVGVVEQPMQCIAAVSTGPLEGRRGGSTSPRRVILTLWEEQQIRVAEHRLAGPEIGDNRPVAVIVVRRADKARRVVGVASPAIPRQLRIRTHGPRERDSIRWLITDIFGADDAGRRDTVLDPLPHRQEDIVV